MIFAVLFLTRDQLKFELGGLFQQLVGDFFRVIPLKRLGAIFFFCLCVVDRQQPRRGRGFDVFFHGAGRHRDGDYLLRLAFRRLRDVGTEIRHAQTREPRNAYRFCQRVVEWPAFARSDHAFFDFQRDAAVLLRCAQILRMHVSIEFQLVLTHGEFGGLAAHAPGAVGLPGKLQRDAFFQLAAVDRMRKINIEHRFFQRGIGWVLIELSAGDFCEQRRGLKFHRVRGQPNL